jgi:hypothetical protein
VEGEVPSAPARLAEASLRFRRKCFSANREIWMWNAFRLRPSYLMLATEGRPGEFLIRTSNQSEILRENVGIQFLSLRHHADTALLCDGLSHFRRFHPRTRQQLVRPHAFDQAGRQVGNPVTIGDTILWMRPDSGPEQSGSRLAQHFEHRIPKFRNGQPAAALALLCSPT